MKLGFYQLSSITKFAYWYELQATQYNMKVSRYLVMDFRQNHRIRGILDIATSFISSIFQRNPETYLQPGVYESILPIKGELSAIERYFLDDSAKVREVLMKLFLLQEAKKARNTPYNCVFYTVYLDHNTKKTYCVPIINWQESNSKAFLKAIGRLRSQSSELNSLFADPHRKS